MLKTNKMCLLKIERHNSSKKKKIMTTVFLFYTTEFIWNNPVMELLGDFSCFTYNFLKNIMYQAMT